MARASVIVNAGAGQGHDDELAASLRDKFAAVGIDARVTLAGSGEEMIGVAREALDDGISLVVAGGGDGTMNAVASALVGRPATFGVLPLGTLNHFAKDLNIPLALDDAIANIAHGRPVAVDVGEVNGRIFLNN